jgi:hypothetical protein
VEHECFGKLWDRRLRRRSASEVEPPKRRISDVSMFGTKMEIDRSGNESGGGLSPVVDNQLTPGF